MTPLHLQLTPSTSNSLMEWGMRLQLGLHARALLSQMPETVHTQALLPRFWPPERGMFLQSTAQSRLRVFQA